MIMMDGIAYINSFFLGKKLRKIESNSVAGVQVMEEKTMTVEKVFNNDNGGDLLILGDEQTYRALNGEERKVRKVFMIDEERMMELMNKGKSTGIAESYVLVG